MCIHTRAHKHTIAHTAILPEAFFNTLCAVNEPPSVHVSRTVYRTLRRPCKAQPHNILVCFIFRRVFWGHIDPFAMWSTPVRHAARMPQPDMCNSLDNCLARLGSLSNIPAWCASMCLTMQRFILYTLFCSPDSDFFALPFTHMCKHTPTHNIHFASLPLLRGMLCWGRARQTINRGSMSTLGWIP